MKEFFKEKLQIILFFILFYLLVEIVTFMWVGFSFLPKDIWIDLVIVFAISSLVFLIKSQKWSLFYVSIFAYLMILLFLVNATMYSVYYDLFTLQQLQLIGEAADVINFELLSIPVILITVGFIALYTVSLIFFSKYLKKKPREIPNYYAKGLATFFVSCLMIFGFFMLNIQSINAYVEDINVTTFRRASFQEYGVFAYYTKEITNMIDSGGNGDYVDLPVDYSEPTDYFGLLEGKNVVNILLESVQPFAINEVLTPNLYRLTQEGLYFENSYSENKTNYSELIGIIGNYPSIRLYPATNTYDFSYALPQILSDEEGYVTSFYHDNVATFYDRGTLMPQLGFDNVYLHEELYPGEDIWRWNGDYTLDSRTMEVMLANDFTTADEPFYTYWATLSTHGPYNYGPVNKQLFTELGYFAKIDQAEADGLWTNVLGDGEIEDAMRIRHYQAAVMDTDKAIGMLLDDLEEKGILDDTIIVLFGDHNVYYHNIYLKMFDETETDYFNMEMYHNFFCIFNPILTETYLDNTGADNTTISKFVTPYNVVPTLMDLLGIRYNQNLYMGSSVFSDTEDVFYSLKMTGFFNSNMYSDDGLEIIYYKHEYTAQELEDFIDKCEILRYKIGYINKYYIYSKEAK